MEQMRSRGGAAFAALVFLSSVSLSACAAPPSPHSSMGAASIPEWQFRWLPHDGDTDASSVPQMAFANAGRAEHLQLGGVTEHVPPAVVWLATGRTFGVAVVQLDPAGRYMTLVTLLNAASSHSWQAEVGDLPRPTPCGPGKQFSGQSAVFGTYCSLVPVRSGSTPAISVTLWTTPQSETFIADRIASAAQRPASGAAPLTLADASGWLIRDTRWIVVVVLLDNGDSVIFASTGDSQRCQELAGDFLRLGADPGSLH